MEAQVQSPGEQGRDKGDRHWGAQDTGLSAAQARFPGEQVSLGQASSLASSHCCGHLEMATTGFPSGPVVTNPPASAGGMENGPGRSHVQCYTTAKPTLEPESHRTGARVPRGRAPPREEPLQ